MTAVAILFWIFVALDCAAVGLFLLLGLAAAGPSHSSPIGVAFFMLAVPGVLLAGVIALFVFSRSPVGKLLALAVAGAPVILVVFGSITNAGMSSLFTDKDGSKRHFAPGPMRELERAIAKNDAAAVAAMARKVDLSNKAMDDYTVLSVAVQQLDQNPRSLEVLRVLLEAGADPNVAQMSMPLERALRLSGKTGLEPARMLLRAGANPNVRNRLGEPVYFSALAQDADPGALALVLQHGADARARTKGGFPPLLWATAAKNWKAVRLLLEGGADWNVANGAGETFLQMLEREKGYIGSKEGFDEVLRLVGELQKNPPTSAVAPRR